MSPPYKEQYSKGSRVRIRGRKELEDFAATRRFHNKLQPEQLEFAGVEATVKSIGFYHGGDVLYWLEGVPGVWHEVCLSTGASNH